MASRKEAKEASAAQNDERSSPPRSRPDPFATPSLSPKPDEEKKKNINNAEILKVAKEEKPKRKKVTKGLEDARDPKPKLSSEEVKIEIPDSITEKKSISDQKPTSKDPKVRTLSKTPLMNPELLADEEETPKKKSRKHKEKKGGEKNIDLDESGKDMEGKKRDLEKFYNYVAYLRFLLLRRSVGEEELKSLGALQRKHGLSDADHLKALEILGITERDFLLACALGVGSKQESRLGDIGEGKKVLIEGFPDKRVYCHGLCIPPYLRQWWKGEDPEQGVEMEPGSDHRTATPNELFYDLVFVALISNLVHLFAEDHSNWPSFIVFFLMIAVVWFGTISFYSYFDALDLSMRVATFLQMFSLICMAISLHDAVHHSGSIAFTWSFAIAWATLFGMFFVAAIGRGRGYQYATTVAVTGTPGLILLIVAAVVNGDGHGHGFLYWYIACIFSPFVIAHLAFRFPAIVKFHQPPNYLHVTERLGLFFLIVLGETITSILNALPWRAEVLRWEVYLCACFALAVAYSIKSLYFDVNDKVRKHAVRRAGTHAAPWQYSHLFLFLGVAVSAAGCLGLINTITYDFETRVYGGNQTELSFGVVGVSEALNSTGYIDEVELKAVTKRHEVFFCIGITVTMLVLTGQALLSKQLRHTLVPSKIRLSIRGVVAVLVALAPAVLNGIILLSVATFLVCGDTLFELVAQLPKGDLSPYIKVGLAKDIATVDLSDLKVAVKETMEESSDEGIKEVKDQPQPKTRHIIQLKSGY